MKCHSTIRKIIVKTDTNERWVHKRAVRELRNTWEVMGSIPSPGGTKAQHPALLAPAAINKLLF